MREATWKWKVCRHRQRHRSGVVAFMCHQLLNLIYILCVPAIALIAFLAGSLSSCSLSIRTDWARAGIFAHLRATAATKGRKFYLLALIWHPASYSSCSPTPTLLLLHCCQLYKLRTVAANELAAIYCDNSK